MANELQSVNSLYRRLCIILSGAIGPNGERVAIFTIQWKYSNTNLTTINQGIKLSKPSIYYHD